MMSTTSRRIRMTRLAKIAAAACLIGTLAVTAGSTGAAEPSTDLGPLGGNESEATDVSSEGAIVGAPGIAPGGPGQTDETRHGSARVAPAPNPATSVVAVQPATTMVPLQSTTTMVPVLPATTMVTDRPGTTAAKTVSADPQAPHQEGAAVVDGNATTAQSVPLQPSYTG